MRSTDGYILALDQGTTSSRAIIFDHRAEIKALSQKEFPQFYPKEGWVEQDPEDIWLSQIGVAREAIESLRLKPEEVKAIGITNQRETTILWDAQTGEAIAPAIVWQCRRTAPMIEELKRKGVDKMIRDKTGLVLDAYFSASKLSWLLEHVPGARQRAEAGELRFGTVDCWLIWRLTRGKVHATDYSNASRTMLFNIHSLSWDQELLDLFEIPVSLLPEVRDSSGDFGMTHPEVFGGISIPIRGVAGDQQASLFGQQCTEEAMVKNTYGTGCFLLMNTGEQVVSSNNGLISTIAWKKGAEIRYALEGSVFIAGAAIQWLRDAMRLIYDAAQSEYYADMLEDTDGVVVVPAFTGLGAPYWDMYARGAIFGISRGTRREHIVRATLESIAYQSRDMIEAMERDMGRPMKDLMVDGGASKNDFLMQFQADLLDADVHRLPVTETTAMGAAFLAGLDVGFWKDELELKEKLGEAKIFNPKRDEQWRKAHYDLWKDAVGRSLGWRKERD